MQIPAEIEKMILQGRAEFSAVTHNADQFIIQPPEDGYQIIFGFQVHYPLTDQEGSTTGRNRNYSIIAAMDNNLSFYQAKVNITGSGVTASARRGDQPTDFILYAVTENPVYFSVIWQEGGSPTLMDNTFSTDFLDALPVGYLPESFLGWGGVPYLLANTAPLVSPDALYYLPFGQPFTNTVFPGQLTNPEGLGFNSWFLHPKDLSNPNARIYPNTDELQTEAWASVLGVTVYSVKVKESFPQRTNNKFVI